MHRSPTAAVAALALLAAANLVGCTGGSAPPAADGSAAPAASTAPLPTAPGSSPDSAGSTELTGMVGTADDPDAYAIALLDASGSPVTTLPAGDYSLTFSDRSDIHNIRISGPGGVDEATEVRGSDESTVEVSLEPGTYTIVCDPHSGTMRVELEVTG
ncbi:hypothetical protein [Agrococcus sp. HG114]|uniref:hypothetical protein n=1 Tax=Agrococcus sp. HG114 TaxID=2969757 RepID=UPI00215AB7FF|nr:hypothetical protein [Agrococcus sp. HG114]MCR8671650.1 hypothetical protein [Agrococcus sp. HG114]